MQNILNCTQVIGVSNYNIIFTRIINSYLHHVFEQKCTKFCLKHSSYSIRGHIRPSGEYLWGKGESLFSPAHPCLTNSRGDSSIQGVINTTSKPLNLFPPTLKDAKIRSKIANVKDLKIMGFTVVVCLQGQFSHARPPVHCSRSP